MEYISDQELLNAFHKTDKSYNVTFTSGQSFCFGADSLLHAKRMAREYGLRFLNGQKVLILEWVKE